MNYQTLHRHFQNFPLFSLQDIRLIDPKFDRRRLTEWQDLKLIRKIRRGWYRLVDQNINENVLFYVANHLCMPSYVSLEMALSWYHLIPESVYHVTSVTTSKTQRFETADGFFDYQHVVSSRFFGYHLESFGIYRFMMADLEKAILDLLYLNPHLRSNEDFDGLRLRTETLAERLDRDLFQRYVHVFDQQALTIRAELFLNYLDHA